MKKRTKIILTLGILMASFTLVMATPDGQNLPTVNNEKVLNGTLEFSAFLVNQDLNLEFTQEAPANFTVELYSLTGKKMDTWEVEKVFQKSCQLSLQRPLPKSIYIVKIIAQQQMVAKKVQF